METERVRNLVVLGCVHGLANEARVLLAALEREPPDVLLLALSVESLAALERGSSEVDPDSLADAEAAYAVALERFGEVALPPPDLVAALAWAKEKGVPVEAVDLTEEEYEDTFTSEVGTWSLLRYGRLVRRMVKRPPEASTPEAFARAWDRSLRRIKGLAAVEAARESAIAERSLKHAERRRAVLVLDVARFDGVVAALRARQGKD
ncbi:MAG TPA: hypothetical protein VM889_05535 [Candidatus Thermoplasmatota archaeon]|nr:hypothetical protein [Candidatus Thermoplasmatota archaeon]